MLAKLGACRSHEKTPSDTRQMGFFFFSPSPPNTLIPNSLAPEHSHPRALSPRTLSPRTLSLPNTLTPNSPTREQSHNTCPIVFPTGLRLPLNKPSRLYSSLLLSLDKSSYFRFDPHFPLGKKLSPFCQPLHHSRQIVAFTDMPWSAPEAMSPFST